MNANEECNFSKEELLRVISDNFCPPSSYLVFGFLHILKWTSERIVDELYDKTLGEIVEIFETELFADKELSNTLTGDCLKDIKGYMNQPLGEVVKAASYRKLYRKLLEKIVGEIPLNQFYGHLDNQSLAEEWNSCKELDWILKAREGNHAAFEKLYKKYENQIHGFIRLKVFNYEDFQEVTQESMIMLWEKGIENYNPAFTHFSRYIRNQLRYVILKHHRDEQNAAIAVSLLHQNSQIEQDQAVLNPAKPVHINPETQLFTKQIFELFADRVFGSKELPHKKLAFGFSKLLIMPPRTVVKHYSAAPFNKLSVGFQLEYSKFSHIPRNQLSELLSPMDKQLNMKFSAANFDKKTFNTYQYIGVKYLKDSKFSDYYTQKTNPTSKTTPEKNIAQWTEQMKGRILNTITPEVMEDLGIRL